MWNRSKNLDHTLSWKEMLDFNHSPKGSGVAFSGGILYGWLYYLVKLLDVGTLGWEFLVKLGGGIVSAVIIGFCVKVSNDFYEKRVKDLIFKPKTNAKAKDNNERAA